MSEQPPGSGPTDQPASGGAEPNPWSRESSASGAHSLGGEPTPPSARPDPPAGQGQPGYGDAAPGHGQPAPRYGEPAPDQGQGQGQTLPGYGQPAPGYGQPTPGYGQPAPGYGEPAPDHGQQAPTGYPEAPQAQPDGGYQPAPGPDPLGAGGYGYPGAEQPGAYGQPGYGGVSPYPGGYGGSYPGYGVPQADHPQSTAALVTGIIGLATGVLCGVGGLVGIAAIVLGLKARREIDGDPARWGGRGKATAGLVMGVVGLVALLGWILLFVLIGAANPS